MFKTIKAKVAIYKWTIIISLIGLLTVGVVWQYHRASMLETQTTELKEEAERLNISLQTTHRQFIEYKESTNKALEDLQTLRASIAEISAKTAGIQNQVNGFKKTPVQPGGTNAKELEDQANSVTQEIFRRMEDSSRGKTK